MKLQEFLKTYDLDIRLHYYDSGRIGAHFYPIVEIKDGIFLRGLYGTGTTEKKAISNLCEIFSNQKIKINNKEYINTPIIEYF